LRTLADYFGRPPPIRAANLGSEALKSPKGFGAFGRHPASQLLGAGSLSQLSRTA